MSKSNNSLAKTPAPHKRSIIITLAGALVMIFAIIATLDISHRNINPFVTAQQKYILSLESTILVFFVVELVARLASTVSYAPRLLEHGSRLRLIIRIVGYTVGLLSVVSILASNAALGISVGAVAGVVIAFATQNIVGSVLAAVLLLGTRMVRVGEEISISGTKGVVSDIRLTYTVLSVDDDVVFVPNSLIISSLVRRKKRDSTPGASASDW